MKPERLDSDSVFPPEEAASINSRPTPIVPASQELRTLGQRSHPPRPLDAQAREMQITQPDGLARRNPAATTEPPPLAPDELRPSSRPTASFRPDQNSERDFFEAAPGPQNPPSLAPLAGRPRPRSRARTVFARVLFVMIFAAVATLLGVAIKKKLELSKNDSPLSAFVR